MPPAPDTDVGATTSVPVRLTGISSRLFEHDRLFARIEADEFRISPRQFWIFNVKSVNEAWLSKARVTVFLTGQEKEGRSVLPFFEPGGLLSLPDNRTGSNRTGSRTSGLGLVTRGVIDGLEVTVYQLESPTFRLTAGRGEADLKRRTLTLTDVTVEDPPSGRTLRAHSAVWKDREQVLQIPGEYTAESRKGRAAGRGIEVDVSFRLRPLT